MNGQIWSLGVLAAALLAGCGGGGGVEDPPAPAVVPVTMAVSDAPVDDAEAVVVTIDRIILRPAGGGADVVVETFSNSAEGIEDEETITFDLLDYQGGAHFVVFEAQPLPVGDYQHVILEGPFDDITQNYVQEVGGALKPIKVPSNELKLGQMVVAGDGAVPNYTIEFDLRQSMNYKPGPDEYTLKPRGVRIVQDAEVATVAGTVEVALLSAGDGCDAKVDAAEGNVVYLYGRGDEPPAGLADVTDPDVANNGLPEGYELPFAAAPVVWDEAYQEYRFAIGFVPAGDYRLAFACDAASDDPDLYDGIVIANPADSLADFSLTGGEDIDCSFTAEASACSAASD